MNSEITFVSTRNPLTGRSAWDSLFVAPASSPNHEAENPKETGRSSSSARAAVRRCGGGLARRGRLERLHEGIFDVLKSAAFHPLTDEALKFRFMNFDEHRGGSPFLTVALTLLQTTASANPFLLSRMSGFNSLPVYSHSRTSPTGSLRWAVSTICQSIGLPCLPLRPAVPASTACATQHVPLLIHKRLGHSSIGRHERSASSFRRRATMAFG